jgi:hypothetical protein
MKSSITITFDTDSLHSYTDQHIAALWHVAQANPADGFKSHEPGQIAEAIGREIIRRFLAQTPPELWAHQGRHFESGRLMDLRQKHQAPSEPGATTSPP